MEWKNETLSNWVQHSPPFWATELIQNWTDVFPRDFPKADVYDFVQHAHSGPGDIDLDTVVGQWEHYAGQTWLNALFQPQYKPSKMQRILAMADTNPGYYFSMEPKDIFFDSIDGRTWYSHGGGNHRTVVGKFLHAMARSKSACQPLLHSVHKAHYQVDWQAFATFKQLQSLIKEQDLNISVAPWKILLHRERTDTHQVEISETAFYVADYRFKPSGQSAHLPAAEFLKFAHWVLDQDGKFTTWDMARNWASYLFGKYQGTLVYPGGTSASLISRRAFSRIRQLAWSKRLS